MALVLESFIDYVGTFGIVQHSTIQFKGLGSWSQDWNFSTLVDSLTDLLFLSIDRRGGGGDVAHAIFKNSQLYHNDVAKNM